MAKIQFDIKYRPQIESGEYKVFAHEHEEQEARIVCWDNKGEYPIVALVDNEPEKFDKHGRVPGGNRGGEFSLFIITPEKELTECEKTLIGSILTFGKETQINQAVEEMAELTAALNHFRRGRIDKDAVASEIADVIIMMEQLSLIFGAEAVHKWQDSKLERLEKRIEEANKKTRKRDDRVEKQMTCAYYTDGGDCSKGLPGNYQLSPLLSEELHQDRFRMLASAMAMAGFIAREEQPLYPGAKETNCSRAIEWADELIKQLKKE